MNKSVKKIENALQLKYIQFLRAFLWFVGGWPSKALKDLGEPKRHWISTFQKIESPILFIVTFSGALLYVKEHYTYLTFSDKGLIYINENLSFLTWARMLLLSVKGYGKVVRDFLVRVHLFNFRNQSAFYQKIYNKVDKFSHYFTYYSMGVMVLGLILYNLMPMYSNYRNGVFTSDRVKDVKLEFSVMYEYPGFRMSDNFYFMTALNWYLSVITSVCICGPDALLSLMIFNMIGHVMILNDELASIAKPKRQQIVEFINVNGEVCASTFEVFDHEENDHIHKKLSECIEHHKLIIRETSNSFHRDSASFNRMFLMGYILEGEDYLLPNCAMENISNVFGPVLGFNYGISLSICCVLLLQCSQNDPVAILRFGPLTMILFFQLIQMSVTFEYIGTVSEKLDSAIYLMPWECMDSRNRRTVCILLQRVQTPIHVTAMGLTPIGVTTMSKILKATFSYFMFLQSIV